MSIFEYDKEEEEKKLRKAEYEYGYEEGKEAGIEEGRKEGYEEGSARILLLLSQMTAGGDVEQISQLNNPEVLEEMKRKYEIE